VKVRHTSPARIGLLVISLLWLVVALPLSVSAAPYAAYVIDARSGEVLHARNADTRLHPASLTKMMTLYVAFQAIENGEISLDTVV
jgi:D-alanyl-D-alanine carboxypeptidase